jgi:thiol-disulfide isomerase/thioredoxin
MEQVMYERLGFTLAVFAFAWMVRFILKRRQAARSDQASKQMDTASGRPALVYFWAHGCSVCKGTQRPILEAVLEEYGKDRLTFIAYNVEETPHVADAWGVRTLPTTFLLDQAGKIRHINNGLITSEKLHLQLKAVLPESPTLNDAP